MSDYELSVDGSPVEPAEGWTLTWLDRRCRRRPAGPTGRRSELCLVEGSGTDWVVTLRGRRIPVVVRTWRERVLADAESASRRARRPDRGAGDTPRAGGGGRGQRRGRGGGRGDAPHHRGDEDAERGPRAAGRARRGRRSSSPARRSPPARRCCASSSAGRRWPPRTIGGDERPRARRHGLRIGPPRGSRSDRSTGPPTSMRPTRARSPAPTPSRAASVPTGTSAGPGRCASTRASARPPETNRRFRYLLASGQTGLSVAFDLPTQMGYDSDDPMAVGEVGRVGRADRHDRRHGGPLRRDPARCGEHQHDHQRHRRHPAGPVRDGRAPAGDRSRAGCAARSRTTSSRSTSRAVPISIPPALRCGW